MSTITRHKKKAEAKAKAEGKLKGKKALTATAKKTKKETLKEEQPEIKSSILNFSRCCTCKSYTKFPDGYGHMCKLTNSPTPRKATCEKYAYND